VAYRVDVMLVGSWGKSMTHNMAWKITTAISSGLCMVTLSPRWHITSMVNSSKWEAGMTRATQETVKPLSSLTGMYHVYWVEKCIDLLACPNYAKNRTDGLVANWELLMYWTWPHLLVLLWEISVIWKCLQFKIFCGTY
jgi:hypothetical protein